MIVLGPDFRVPAQFGPLQITFLFVALDVLQKAARRNTADLVITSYARNAMQNVEAGGKPNSLHQVGLAMDVQSQAMALFGLLDFITANAARREVHRFIASAFRALAPPYTQAVEEGDHVHLELDLG